MRRNKKRTRITRRDIGVIIAGFIVAIIAGGGLGLIFGMIGRVIG